MKKNMRWTLPLTLIFIVVFGSLACLAQSTNAAISAAALRTPPAPGPGVTVTVTNVDTGVAKSFVTNQSGLYDTDSIVTGNYTVTFTKGRL